MKEKARTCLYYIHQLGGYHLEKYSKMFNLNHGWMDECVCATNSALRLPWQHHKRPMASTSTTLGTRSSL